MRLALIVALAACSSPLAMPDAASLDGSARDTGCGRGLYEGDDGECHADPSFRWVVSVVSLTASGQDGIAHWWRVCIPAGCTSTTETRSASAAFDQPDMPPQPAAAFMPALELVVNDIARGMPEVCRARIDWAFIEQVGLACSRMGTGGRCDVGCGSAVTLGIRVAPW